MLSTLYLLGEMSLCLWSMKIILKLDIACKFIDNIDGFVWSRDNMHWQFMFEDLNARKSYCRSRALFMILLHFSPYMTAWPFGSPRAVSSILPPNTGFRVLEFINSFKIHRKKIRKPSLISEKHVLSTGSC